MIRHVYDTLRKQEYSFLTNLKMKNIFSSLLRAKQSNIVRIDHMVNILLLGLPGAGRTTFCNVVQSYFNDMLYIEIARQSLSIFTFFINYHSDELLDVIRLKQPLQDEIDGVLLFFDLSAENQLSESYLLD